MNRTLRQYFDLVFGSVLLSLGISLFVTPNHINFGGVIGISQILSHFSNAFGILDRDVTGIVNFLINVPLFVLAYKIMDLNFCIKTLISILIQTVVLSLFPALTEPIVDDVLLNCIFGALVCGIGVGYGLRSSACCGGIDIPCMCLVKRHPDFKTGGISIAINAVLFSICLFLFDVKSTMYSIVFVFAMYAIADRFHYQNINIAALIFTDNKEMKQIIMERTGRGVTFWNGYGAYTGKDKDILFCALNKYEIAQLKAIIHEADPKAFVTFFEGPSISGGFEKRL